MYGWHLGRAGRICKLEDIRYVEVELLQNVENPEDGSLHDYIRERTWFIDEYGGKQAWDNEYHHEEKDWHWNNPFFPYYQCDSCLVFLRSWEEAKIHVGDDEDIDEPALMMINKIHREDGRRYG